ncbi:tetratricopeptide repeat protein 28-like, partial [Aplysia californica]|uniref:Tetratricopeptide repeat protein 28-like n=1 Tax=Aplysia californica TaxID=6500 RepID=A0ABM1AFJ2_APLCA
MPKAELVRAQQELVIVAECLGSFPVMSEEATRHVLLERLEKAEVVHIATWACLREGILLVTPDPVDDQAEDSSHLVTVADLLNTSMCAKLVVLSSCGLSAARHEQECVYKLASAFLSAGCQCVLVSHWPLPDDLLGKFYFHFYQTLQNGAFLSEALQAAVQAIKADD